MCSHSPSSRTRGFTLIELMIVVVIVAVLAMIVLPSFAQQMRKSRRTDAMQSTMAVQQAQERWRANNVAYTGTLSDLNIAAVSSKGYYQIAITGASATEYTVSATAIAGKGQDQDSGCATLTVAVAAGAASSTPAGCWSR